MIGRGWEEVREIEEEEGGRRYVGLKLDNYNERMRGPWEPFPIH